MFETLHRAAEIPAAGLNSLPSDVVAGGQPTVLRAAFRDWPFVRAALQSYVFQFDGDPMKAISLPHRASASPVDPSQIAKLREALRTFLAE